MQTGNGTKTRENKIVIIRIIVPLTGRHTLELYSNNTFKCNPLFVVYHFGYNRLFQLCRAGNFVNQIARSLLYGNVHLVDENIFICVFI